MSNRFIEYNNKKYEIPNTWEEFVNSMTLKNIQFNSIKRERFEENSSLIRLLDSYFQAQHSKGELTLPELKTMGNESIAIFSDYGGEHKGSKYNSYSFLFCGWNHCYHISEALKKVRKKYDLSKKEISFKDLDYGPSFRALDEYLETIDRNVYGFSLTILIDRKLSSLFIGNENIHLLKEIENAGLGRWHKKAAEKLMRILHVIGYVLPLIADSDQKVIWMSDKDPVIQNSEMFNNALGLLKAVLKVYSDNKYKQIGGSKLPFANKDIHTMDLLSVTDLIAGSVEQYFTTEQKEGSPFLKNGAEKVIKWLATSGDFLKKEVIRIHNVDNELRIEGIKFKKE
ncbi:hypothetical protein [Saccharicrinis aurantiacus]|uniref:hypothetical protein n=1 Tax=Saccharicrinis aurantiacus TaxID=1849719 RepID=UPI00094F6A47|nr:hypothetical protein [Saccharicrinis aurantiacus]